MTTLDSALLPAAARSWAERARGAADQPVDWVRWEVGVRACYHYAGLRFPRVVRVSSPLALARALFLGRINEVPGDEDRAMVGLMRRVTQARVDRVVSQLFDRSVLAASRRGLFDPVDAATGAAGIAAAVHTTIRATAAVDDRDDVRLPVLAAAQRIRDAVQRPRHIGTRLLNRVCPSDWLAWTLHLGGPGDAAWAAWAAFLGEAYGNAGARGWRNRIEAFGNALRGEWWWPHLDFVLVSDRPSLVRTEPDTDGGPGRLHCADGPAVHWRDGWSLHFWHGTQVPSWVIHRPTPDAVHAEPNVEVRRCAIEAMGWDTYIAGAGLRLVDSATDPGNTGNLLHLYEVPPAIWGTPGRVLLVTNGSVERDGTRRRYGLPVPDDVTGALDAAAWTYGLSDEQYARLFLRR